MVRARRFRDQRDALLERLRADGIDDRVVDAVAAVPRERFVPRGRRPEAYEDRPLPIGHDVTISQPSLVARMLELAGLADLGQRARVLDVGTGSGWAAALAARLVGEVVSVERVPALADRARRTLAAIGADGVEVVVGDGWDGWPERAPYDAVLVAAAADEVPGALVEQLAQGGRLVLPLGAQGRAQTLVRLTRTEDGVEREDLLGVRFVPLVPGVADDAPDDRSERG